MLPESGISASVSSYTHAQLYPGQVREGLQFCKTDNTAEHCPFACCYSLWSSTAFNTSLHNQEKITLFFFPPNAEPRVCRGHYRAEMLLSWPVIAFVLVTLHVNMAGPFSSIASSLVMPSKGNPQALMQKQKWCPAVSTTPTRLHWVTIKPYSKVYLSSLKGSALTLGVSIDLGNTVPSAPEITKQNRRQIVNIMSCYQGSDCQIIPRCNLTHCLTPLSFLHIPSVPRKARPCSSAMGCLDHTWDLPFALLAGKAAAWTPTWGESADPTDAGSLEKTPLANQASHPATSLIKEPGCMWQHYCFCWALRDTQRRKANFDLILANTSPVRLCSCLGKRREVHPHTGQHNRPCSSPSLATSSGCDPEII